MTENNEEIRYQKKLYALQDELWKEFDIIVKKGAKFSTYIDVEYPYGINPDGMIKTNEGRSTFLAKEIISNPNYSLLKGADIIIGANEVEFIDLNNDSHKIEPNIVDLHFLSKLVDEAQF